MWEYFEVLLKRNNLRISDVQKGTGIPYSTFTDWKAGRYTPKMDKMKKIADFFDVSVDYLMTGKEAPKESTSGKIYYFSDETAEAAVELLSNPYLSALMSAARGCPDEIIKSTTQLLTKLKETNPYG